MKAILKGTAFAAAALCVMAACNEPKPAEKQYTASGLDPELFVDTVAGIPMQLYTLKNAAGTEVCITNLGGRVVSIMVPDREGLMKDVVLGFDNVRNYEDKVNSPSDFGASIGRYANRINQGKITINGEEIQLPQNNFGHCLHGGPDGWQYRPYEAVSADSSSVVLKIVSPDGDMNFPGEVTAVVTYTLTEDNVLDIAYEATTTKTTVINMTNHSYFNLNGNPNEAITNHELYVNADAYTPVDATFMTTGAIVPVEGTPMDFRTPHAVGQDIKNFEFEQIKNGNGFDHNWCLNTKGDDTQVCASIYSPATGICLEVYTDEPGIQVYSGNFLDGTAVGKGGIVYNQHAAICLETQKYPDTPNKSNLPGWPSAILEPGQTYTSHCAYKFSVK
ncbi:MAG: galactose mutarotase [Bacteroidaceae bacterium]|nr:galactose mutarotase [Bacteroidaceae bacterium]